MKLFPITEAQLQEIAGRANAIAVRGTDCEHIVGINRVLAEIVKAWSVRQDAAKAFLAGKGEYRSYVGLFGQELIDLGWINPDLIPAD